MRWLVGADRVFRQAAERACEENADFSAHWGASKPRRLVRA